MNRGERRRRGLAALLLFPIFAGAAPLLAQAPSFVATPLTEMGLSRKYLGFTGGLYPNGSNVPRGGP